MQNTFKFFGSAFVLLAKTISWQMLIYSGKKGSVFLTPLYYPPPPLHTHAHTLEGVMWLEMPFTVLFIFGIKHTVSNGVVTKLLFVVYFF